MKIKSILSIILTVSIVATGFPLIVQATEQTEEETVSSVPQVVDEIEEIEEIENKMQTAPKPAGITRHFNIDSEDKFIEFMTTPKHHKGNCETNLLCDINMRDATLNPIDNYYGKFNGNGHVVSNMSFSNCCFIIRNRGIISAMGFRNCKQANVVVDADTAGFVIKNEQDGIINDCFIENIINKNSGDGYCAGVFVARNWGRITGCKAEGKVRGKDYVGGFVGLNYGKILNCTATGEVTGNEKVGGFVGDNYSGAIIDCKATENVNGNESVGAFVGCNDNGTIIGCTGEGNVIGMVKFVGGFVGYNDNGTITDCTATGDVSGISDVGGFVGCNNNGAITDCTATGEINAKEEADGNEPEEASGNEEGEFVGGFVGGFVGCNEKTGKITNCAATGNVKGKIDVGGFAGKTEEGGEITNCNSIGNVIVTGNNPSDAIGNGKVLDKKKKAAIGTITAMTLLGATVGGVAFGIIDFDKAGSKLRNAWDSVKAFFNEKVMTNSNYKKVIGALIALGIAAIIIIVPISLSQKKHIDVPVGGFVGENGGKIENCTSSGKVTVKKVSMHVSVGGFAGINGATGTITNCEAEEDVHANTKLSGKAGGFVGNNNGKVVGSKFSGASVYLSTGSLYKDDCCGGFAGKNDAGGSIDWCDVGQAKAESMGDDKKTKKRAATIETTNKTKGGGLVGVAGKLSSTTNCTYNARRKSKTGEVGINSCYKKEKLAIVTNCYAK
ncbi:MAG: hypothetical protein K2G97_04845 [Oscillospiraceae bacterium]|nr:hypothetical protein [Oscillospiraceae bacterium]